MLDRLYRSLKDLQDIELKSEDLSDDHFQTAFDSTATDPSDWGGSFHTYQTGG